MKNLRITVRLEESERKKLDQLIANSHFKNLSDAVRTALRHSHKKREETENTSNRDDRNLQTKM